MIVDSSAKLKAKYPKGWTWLVSFEGWAGWDAGGLIGATRHHRKGNENTLLPYLGNNRCKVCYVTHVYNSA